MGVWGWWAFDIFTLIASYLGVEIVSAQTIMRSLGLLTFMFPIALSIACGMLIGQSIGKESVQLVKHYYKWSMYLAIFVALFQNLLLFSLEKVIISGFTDNNLVAV
jgi:Na+-driven multidrug efflux pump